jgi:hypothetical protein
MNVADANDAIDTKAGAVRAAYITITPGQEATYIMKSAQAAVFKAAGYLGDVPLLVDAEVQAMGITPQQAADMILGQEAQWLYLAAMIERVRRTGKVSVGNATSEEDIEAICVATVSQLAALMP